MVLALCFFGALSLYSPQVRAESDATWSQSSISATFQPGQQKITVVTLTARKALESAFIQITPSLVPYVRVLPTTTPKLRKGQVLQLTITTFAPVDSPPVITQGDIQLREFEKPEKKSKHEAELIARPLPITVNVVWPEQSLALQNIGVKFSFPPNWFISRRDDDHVRVSNSSAEPNEDTFLMQSFLAINRMAARPGTTDPHPANPSLLPVGQWFTEYFKSGFHTQSESTMLVLLGGRQAIRQEIIETGGRWVHLYVPVGTDIIEIAYQLNPPQYLSLYELIIGTVTFSI